MARILIIDDSSFQRKILTSLLCGEQHEVLSAINGLEGLDTAFREHPDLIITDLLMPDMDGFAFLREAQEKHIAIPILIFTSDIQTSTRDRCLALGAAGVLNKPIKKETLAGAVNQALGAVHG